MAYYYTSIVYEEHFETLSNALEMLSMTCILGHINGALVSPIHAPEGNELKPHKHIIWQSNKKRLSKADSEAFKIECLAVNGYVQGVSDRKAMEEYLTHKNHPNKQQFGIDELPMAYGAYVGSDDVSMSHIFAFMSDNNITEYSDLINGLIMLGNEELLNLACKRAFSLQAYLMSLREKNKAQATAENNELYQRERKRKSASEDILERFY